MEGKRVVEVNLFFIPAGLLGCEAVLSSMALMQAGSMPNHKKMGSHLGQGQRENNHNQETHSQHGHMVLPSGVSCPPLVREKYMNCVEIPDVNDDNSLSSQVQKNFICEHCYSAFRSSYHLKRHILTHTGEKPFACDMCDMRFIQRYHLERHKRVHSGEKPYQCDRCQQVRHDKHGDLAVCPLRAEIYVFMIV
ncbi:hypothetical protein cypCar_00039117 [Cyprinus carpio]|nr:hypothetical protein cypCar_00039117 [Cyprinus carpio]